MAKDYMDLLPNESEPEQKASSGGNSVMYQGVQKYLDGDLPGAKADLAEAKKMGITGNTNLAYAIGTIDREQAAIAKLDPMHYMDSLPNEEDASSLSQSYKNLPETNPDQSAKIIDLAKRTNQPEDFIAENLPAAEEAAKAKPSEFWRQIEKDYPGTTKWLHEDQNMAVAHDDVDALGERERVVDDVRESLGFLLDPSKRVEAAERAFKGTFKKAPAGFTSGTLQVRYSELGWQQLAGALATGEHDPAFDHELGGIEKKLAEYHKDEPGFDLPYYGAQQVPNLMLMARKGAERGMQGALVFGAGSLLFGAPGAAVAPAAFALGGAAGGRIGAAEGMLILEGGAAYREFSQMKDKNGNPIAPRLAAEMGLLVGVINSGLEYVSLLALLRTIPGGNRILGRFVKEKGVFAGLAPKQAVKEAAKRYLASMLAEVGTEVAQEGVGVGVGELGKKISGQPFEPIAPGEAIKQIAGVISPAAQATALLGMPGTVIHIAGEVNKFQQTDTIREAFVKLGEMAEKSKLAERCPEALGHHLNSITAGTELQDVYIPADAFAEYCKKNELDPKELAAKLGIDTLYQEATEAHGDMKMPSGDWAVAAIKAGKDIGRNLYQELTDDTKTNPDGYTPRQASELKELYQYQFEGEVKRKAEGIIEADPTQKEAKQQIYDQRYQALIEAGRPEKEAVADAELLSSAAISLSAQSEKSMTPEQASQALVAKIQGVEDIEAPTKPGKVTPEITEKNIETARKKLYSEAKAEVDAFPEYQAAEYLRKKLGPGYRKIAIKSMERDIIARSHRYLFGSAAGTYGLGDAESLIKLIAELPLREETIEEMVNTKLAASFGDPRYFQYAGEQLTKAKEMAEEGKTFDEIQKNTGWVNENGQWRYSPGFGVFGPDALYQMAPPTESEAFKKWFGDSKVIDDQGKPLVVYSGHYNMLLDAIGLKWTSYFQPRPGVMPVYLSIKNPLDASKGFPADLLAELKNIAKREKKPEGRSYSKEYTIRQWVEDIESDNDFWTCQVPAKALPLLQKHGYDGFKELGTKGKNLSREERQVNWIAFEPTQIKSVFNRGTWSQTDPDILKQAAAGAFDPRTKDILLSFKKANASTFVHEMAHAWLTLVDEMVKGTRASESLAADHIKLMVWLKAEYGKPITREQQEKFASAFEAYLRDGKAPSAELRTAFARFKRWLNMIYRSIQEIGGGILGEEGVSQEVREVMDRMLATEEEIKTAEKVMDYSAELEFAQLDPKVQKKLEDLRKAAHEEAAAELLKIQMAEIAEDRKAFLDSERQRITEEITETLKQSPARRAALSVADSEADAQALAKKLIDGQLETDSVEFNDFEVSAEMLDFYSGEEMAKEILAIRPLAEEVAEAVASRMTDAYADLKDTAAIKGEAMKAVHNDRQIEVLALEREILKAKVEGAEATAEVQRQTKVRVWIEAEFAKSQARKVIAGLKLSEIRSPEKYFTAERIAAVRVAKAMARKDYSKAAQYKHTQLLNHALGMTVIKTRKQIDKTLEQIKKISKIKQDKLFTQETFVQVHQILFRFGFMNDSGRFAREETLDQYLGRVALAFQGGEGDESSPSDLPGWILDEGTRIVANNLTTEQLEDVKDALQNIVHVAKMTDRFYVMAEKESIGEMASILADVAEKNVKKKKPVRAVEGARERFDAAVKGYTYSLEQIGTVISRLDGWKDFGSWHKVFLETVKNAADSESARRWEFIDRLNKGWAAYSQKEINEINSKKIAVPEFGIDKGNPIYKHQLIGMALNLGNETNMNRLMDTPPVGFRPSFEWSRANREEVRRVIMDVLQRHLTKKDWQFVRNTWEIINNPWDEISALHKRVTGFEPKKVEAVPFEVSLPDGEKMTMEGGYYPLDTDPRFSEKAAERELLSQPLYTDLNPGFKAMTKTGHTKGRTNARYAVSLKLSLINRHLNDVLHDLYFRELIIDLRRLGANPAFVNGVKSVIGNQGYRYIDNWIKSVATGRNIEKYSTTVISRIIRGFNRRAAGSIILLRMGVLLQNFANPFLAGDRVEGFGHGDALKAILGRGLMNYWPKCTLGRVGWKAAAEMRDWVWSKSSFMRDRRENPAYTLKDYKGVTAEQKGGLREFTIGLLAASDDMTNIPMWTEGYNKKLKETGDEKQAVNFADLLVSRVTPSARKYDVAQILRSGGDIDKAIAIFYSFWNVEYNNWVRELGKQGKKPIKNAPRFMGFVASRMMFVFASALLAGHKPDPEWDFMKKTAWWVKEYAMYPISFFPFFRDVAGLVLDNALGLPSYGYRPFLMGGVVENLGRATMRIKKYAKGEATEQELVESLSKIASVAVPYPEQLNAWFFNAYDYITNGMEPIFDDLYRRRPVRKR